VAFYNSAKQDRPDSAEAFVKIGAIQMKMRQYKDAAQSFAAAGFLEPEYPEVWLFAARAAREARLSADASSYFFREVEARPSVVGTFLEAAEFFLEANAPQEVLKLFAKFTADFQDDPRVQTRLAQAHFALGELDQAKQAAGTALSADTKNPQAQRLMGLIYDKEAQYSLAKEHFEAYIQLLPQAEDVPGLRAKLSQPPYAGL
jgi:tetratricopeptide (TPR) repeat protein